MAAAAALRIEGLGFPTEFPSLAAESCAKGIYSTVRFQYIIGTWYWYQYAVDTPNCECTPQPRPSRPTMIMQPARHELWLRAPLYLIFFLNFNDLR